MKLYLVFSLAAVFNHPLNAQQAGEGLATFFRLLLLS